MTGRMSRNKVTLELPFPVTLNKIWRLGRHGFHKSQQYSAWLKEAGNMINIQKPGRVEGNYCLSVSLCRPDRRKRDLDNIAAKGVNDLLVRHGIVEDDSLCVETSSRWVEDGPACLVVVSAADRKRAGFAE